MLQGAVLQSYTASDELQINKSNRTFLPSYEKNPHFCSGRITDVYESYASFHTSYQIEYNVNRQRPRSVR